jgi:hypothetical protein
MAGKVPGIFRWRGGLNFCVHRFAQKRLESRPMRIDPDGIRQVVLLLQSLGGGLMFDDQSGLQPFPLKVE